ncbi:MAG: hypothetical protein KKI06_02625 [Euryarchaeota archaeon]|nr:hypothetical protein [Euryarchaeota archaeon]
MKNKRCPECIRPVCQCVLTLNGCREKRSQEIRGKPLNPYVMHDLFTNG